MTLVLLLMQGADGWRTRLAGGDATHLSSHTRHPRSATSDKTNGSQALARPTASMRVSSPPVGTISSASDVTDETDPNSKPRCDGERPACAGARPERAYVGRTLETLALRAGRQARARVQETLPMIARISSRENARSVVVRMLPCPAT